MIVKVTQEHIDKGRRRDCINCPVSLALKEAFKVIYVYTNYTNFDIGLFPIDNLVFSKPIPPEVKSKIIDYDLDYSNQMKPFEFEFSFEKE